MTHETKQLIGIYLGGQFVFCLLGPVTGVMFPFLFGWFYYRAKREAGE